MDSCSICSNSFISYADMIKYLDIYKKDPNKNLDEFIKLNNLLPHSIHKCKCENCINLICSNCVHNITCNTCKT